MHHKSMRNKDIMLIKMLISMDKHFLFYKKVVSKEKGSKSFMEFIFIIFSPLILAM